MGLVQNMPCAESETYNSDTDGTFRSTGNETLGSEKLLHPKLNAYEVNFLQSHRNEDLGSVRNEPSRRFGALFEPQEQVFTLHGGYTDGGKAVGRTNTSLTLSDTGVHSIENAHPPQTIGSLMCHTVTKINSQYNCLLVGGRTTPLRPLAECWFLNGSKIWQQVESLPIPLYRHAATSVNVSGLGDGVLVFGGRTTGNKSSGRWFLWQHNHGWTELIPTNIELTPRFASSLATNPHNRSCGLLVGGLAEDGAVLPESYWWSIVRSLDKTELYLKKTETTGLRPFHRFGASLVATPGGYYLIGGFDIQGAPSSHQEIAWHPHEKQDLNWTGVSHNLALSEHIILAGHHVVYHDGLLILGGGAICFSFGAYINKSVYYLTKNRLGESGMLMSLEFTNGLSEPKAEETNQDTSRKPNGTSGTKAPKTASVPSITINSRQDFQKMIQKPFPEPFVMRSASLGSCVGKWTPQYVCSQVGADRKVTIHRASSKNMSFLSQTRNFSYVTCSFGEFIGSIENGGLEYFRALSTDERDTAANFHGDFPSLSADFHLPSHLAVTNDQLHSSILRISGPVAMWLHYDVMANMLCQIHGSKNLVLFSPSDVKHLDIPPGGSTSNLDVFSPGAFEKIPLVNTRPWLVTLSPGDILFIPPLWLHAAEPVEGTSIAVNVFFKDMQAGYAAGRDVYGNRDLQAYEEGRKDLQKIVRRFQLLPGQRSRFYLERLAQELQGLVNIQ